MLKSVWAHMIIWEPSAWENYLQGHISLSLELLLVNFTHGQNFWDELWTQLNIHKLKCATHKSEQFAQKLVILQLLGLLGNEFV